MVKKRSRPKRMADGGYTSYDDQSPYDPEEDFTYDDSGDSGGYGPIPDDLLDEDDRFMGMGSQGDGGAYPTGPGYVDSQNAASMAPFAALAQKQQDSLQLLRDAQRRAVRALRPNDDHSAMWLSIASGLLAPTRTGAFGESLGVAAGNAAPYMQRYADADQAYKGQLTQMDYDLAQSLYKDANRPAQIIDWYARNPDGSVGKQKAMLVDGMPVPFGEIFTPGSRFSSFRDRIEWYANASPQERAMYDKLFAPRANQSITNVTNSVPYETQDQKNAADTKKAMADEAYKSLNLANQLNAVLPEIQKTPDVFFGPGGPGLVWAGKAMKQLGFDIGDGVDSASFVSAIMSHLGPAQRIVGSGASSDKDVALFMNSLPGLTQTKAGNIALVKYYNKMAQYNRRLVKILNAAAGRGDFYGMDEQAQAEIDKLGRIFTDDEYAEIESLSNASAPPTGRSRKSMPSVDVEENGDEIIIKPGVP